MYAKELVKLLEKNGWIKISQSGSHLKMRKRKPDRDSSNTQQRITQRTSSNHFKENGTKIIVPPTLIYEYIIYKRKHIKRMGVL